MIWGSLWKNILEVKNLNVYYTDKGSFSWKEGREACTEKCVFYHERGRNPRTGDGKADAVRHLLREHSWYAEEV